MGASTRVSTTSIKILTKGSSRFAENKSNEKQIKIDDKTICVENGNYKRVIKLQTWDKNV